MSIQVIQEKGRTLYLLNGKLHREDGPAIEWDNGDEEWYLYGKRSRAGGPATTKLAFTDSSSNKYYNTEWYRSGKRHNTSGPAIVRFFGLSSLGASLYDEEWWEDGIRLRTKKVLSDRTEYRTDDKYHRIGAPAIVWINGSEDWYIYGKRSRVGGPAVSRKKSGVTILREWWLNDNKISFSDQPAVEKLELRIQNEDNTYTEYYTTEWWSNGEISRSNNFAVKKFAGLDSLGAPMYEYQWYKKGELHRDGAPAIVKPDGGEAWYTDGKLNRGGDQYALKVYVGKSELDVPRYDYYWYTNGVLTRSNNPAVERANGDREWYTNGKRNNSSGPAITKLDGSESWYSNGLLTRGGDQPALIVYAGKDEDNNSLFDRYWYTDGKITRGSDKPAIIKANFDQEWYTNGIRNRLDDKPAIIRGKGDREWWINDKVDRTDNPAIILADGILTSDVANPYLVIYEPYTTTFTSSQITTAFGTYSDKIISITREFKVHTIKLVTQPEDQLASLMSYLETRTINGFPLHFQRVNYGTETWITQTPLASILAIYEPSEVTYTSSQIISAFGEYAVNIDDITKVGKVHNVLLNIIPEEDVRLTMAYARLQKIDDNLLKVRRFTSGQVQRDGSDPGIVTPNGSVWFVNGKIGREGDAAVIQSNGDKFWFKDGILHRIDGPAIEKVNGDQEWYIEGKRSRVGGPAVELVDGTTEWWLDGFPVRFGNLPAKTIFVGYAGKQNLWIKTYPLGGLKSVFKTGVTGNSSYDDTLTWITTDIPVGSYYYVSQTNPNNYGIINVNESVGDPPIIKTYDVTLNNSGNFYLQRGLEEGEKLTVEVFKGDTLVLNINAVSPLFDQQWFNVFNTKNVFKPINSGSITSASTKTLKLPLQTDLYDLSSATTLKIDDPIIVRNFNYGTLLYVSNGPASGYVKVVDKKIVKEDPVSYVNLVVEFYSLNIISTVSWNTTSFVSIVDGGKFNRTDGQAALVKGNGDEFWYQEGNLYRDGVQPAVEKANGDKEWYNGLDLVFKASVASNITSTSAKRVKVSPQVPEVTVGSVLYIDGPSPGYVIVIGRKDEDSISMKLDLKYYLLNTNATVSWTTTSEMKFAVRGNLHRVGNPAIIKSNGDQYWYKNGLLHRIGQPAVERVNGDKEWHVDGYLYRDDINPAIEKGNGDRYWYNSYTLTMETTQASTITPTTPKKIRVTPQVPEVNFGSVLYIAGSTPGYVIVTSRSNISSSTMEIGIKYSQINTSGTLSWGSNAVVSLTIRGKLNRVGGPAVEYANGSVEYWLKGVKQP